MHYQCIPAVVSVSVFTYGAANNITVLAGRALQTGRDASNCRNVCPDALLLDWDKVSKNKKLL
jgi:hypothetical protein